MGDGFGVGGGRGDVVIDLGLGEGRGAGWKDLGVEKEVEGMGRGWGGQIWGVGLGEAGWLIMRVGRKAEGWVASSREGGGGWVGRVGVLERGWRHGGRLVIGRWLQRGGGQRMVGSMLG